MASLQSVTDVTPITPAQGIPRFSEYSDEIEALINRVSQDNQIDIARDIIPGILNGEAIVALKRLVPIDVRRGSGMFFTSNDLADKVAERLSPILRARVKLIDPACGAGNLLLACAKYLPAGSNLKETLATWSELVFGYDLHPEFVRATRLRLTLLAMSFHLEEIQSTADVENRDFFQEIRVGDVFAGTVGMRDACIAVNPPFGHMLAPDECHWGKGKVQIAAWFLEKLMRNAHEGQHLVAILPDVLRSGSRYQKWREVISRLCTSIHLEPAGRFDGQTDVDVFVLHGIRGAGASSAAQWATDEPLTNGSQQHVVGDFFEVRVGPVVPHRDPLDGPSYPYIHARTAVAWQTLGHLPERRRYAGTVFTPPFIVVHRTSSPGDKHRCVATIISGEEVVAIENHLLVLLPRDKSILSCERLLEVLKSRESSEWLNRRIRCRHLTVEALRELPCARII